MQIVRDQARADLSSRAPCLPPYPCTPSERRALYEAGRASLAKRIDEAHRAIKYQCDQLSAAREREEAYERFVEWLEPVTNETFVRSRLRELESELEKVGDK